MTKQKLTKQTKLFIAILSGLAAIGLALTIGMLLMVGSSGCSSPTLALAQDDPILDHFTFLPRVVSNDPSAPKKTPTPTSTPIGFPTLTKPTRTPTVTLPPSTYDGVACESLP